MEKSTQTVTELLTKLDKLVEDDKRIQAEIVNRMKEVRARIRGGETSGDHVLDFVIVKCGYRDDPTLTLYRNLNKRFSENQGGLFLAVEKWEEGSGCCGFGPTPDPRNFHRLLKTAFYLGIISGDKLLFDLKDERCDFPLGLQVVFKDAFMEDAAINVLDAPLTRRLHCGRFEDHLDQPLKCENPLNQETEHKRLELFFGDGAVEEYFARHQRAQCQARFALMKKILGK